MNNRTVTLYSCDNWVVIKYPDHYRLLVGTSGGYAQSNSWRINSGIVGVEYADTFYYFLGASGSIYQCHEDQYGLRFNNAYVWDKLKEQCGGYVSILDKNTDWLTMNWGRDAIGMGAKECKE